jgi:hypothetical protein
MRQLRVPRIGGGDRISFLAMVLNRCVMLRAHADAVQPQRRLFFMFPRQPILSHRMSCGTASIIESQYV